MKISLLVGLIWTITACSTFEHKELGNNTALKEYVVPYDWKPINAFNVEFYIPPDIIEKQPIKPMMKGSTAKFYGNENIWLVFTIQSNSEGSNRFIKERDFRLEKTFVDGKQAEITTFTGTEMFNEAEGKNYVAVLDVPQIQGNSNNLLMWAYSKSPEDRETVIKIFKSVQF
jgi:hypothetical protein